MTTLSSESVRADWRQVYSMINNLLLDCDRCGIDIEAEVFELEDAIANNIKKICSKIDNVEEEHPEQLLMP